MIPKTNNKDRYVKITFDVRCVSEHSMSKKTYHTYQKRPITRIKKCLSYINIYQKRSTFFPGIDTFLISCDSLIRGCLSRARQYVTCAYMSRHRLHDAYMIAYGTQHYIAHTCRHIACHDAYMLAYCPHAYMTHVTSRIHHQYCILHESCLL